MLKPVISVVVPVFQAESFLKRCVTSIINQTFTKLQIILVDDGSTDASLGICLDFENRDSRIKVVHTENQGAAHARNVGLSLAEGDYISLIDADDYISPYFYEVLISTALKCNADIVECDYLPVNDEKDVIAESVGEQHDFRLFSAEEAMNEHVHDHYFKQVVWNKIYRREILQGSSFVEGKVIDDEFWTYRIIGNSNRLVHIFERLYYYVQHDSSVMHKDYNLKRLQALEAKQVRFAYLQVKFPALDQVACADLYFSCMYHMQMAFLHLDQVEINTAWKFVQSVIQSSIVDFKFAHVMGTKQKCWIVLSRINFRLTCKIRNKLKVGI